MSSLPLRRNNWGPTYWTHGEKQPFLRSLLSESPLIWIIPRLPCCFCPSPWLSLYSPPLCSHIFRANTIWGNHAPSRGWGTWSVVAQQGVEVDFSGLPSSAGRALVSQSRPASTLPPSKRQAKILISCGGGPPLGLSLLGLGPAWRPGLFTPLWLPRAADSVGPGAVNLSPNHAKLLCTVWPTLAGLFITR